MFTPFEWDDHNLLREALPRKRGAAVYSDSWLYLTQACRGAVGPLGAYFSADGFFVGLGLHRNHWVLVRPTGTVPRDFMAQLSRFIADSGRSPVLFVKKAGGPEFTQLSEHAKELGIAVRSGSSARWSADTAHDDDTYPEYIVDTQWARGLVHAHGRGSQRLRSKLRQCGNVKPQFDTLYSASTTMDVRQFVLDHFDADADSVSSYDNMIRILVGQESTRWAHFVMRDDQRNVIGFFAYEWLDDDSVGVYAALAARSVTGLSERLMIELFEELSRKGARWANLGGSETASLDSFKRKFSNGRHHRNELFTLDFSSVVEGLLVTSTSAGTAG